MVRRYSEPWYSHASFMPSKPPYRSLQYQENYRTIYRALSNDPMSLWSTLNTWIWKIPTFLRNANIMTIEKNYGLKTWRSIKQTLDYHPELLLVTIMYYLNLTRRCSGEHTTYKYVTVSSWYISFFQHFTATISLFTCGNFAHCRG